MNEKLTQPWPKRNARVVVMGATGSGKSTIGASLQRTIKRHHQTLQVMKANREYTEQSRRVGRHEAALPTLPDKPETATFQARNMQADWEFWAGENAMFNKAVNAREIDAALRSRGVDVLVLTLNPFQHDPELAEYSFIELTWWIQQKTAFTLGKSADIAGYLLWGLTDNDSLRALNSDFDELDEAQLREGRVVRNPTAKFGLALDQCFRIEGCDGADEVLEIFARTARTTGAHTLEVLNLRAIAALRPSSTIVAGTHADLLRFLPGVGAAEFLRSCTDIFPDRTEVRISQAIAQPSLNISVRRDRAKSIYIEGPSMRSGPLLESVVQMVERSNPRDLGRVGWAMAAVALIALATTLVAVLGSPWVPLPLAFIIPWALAYCTGFRPQRKWAKRRAAAEPTATVQTIEANRIARQFQQTSDDLAAADLQPQRGEKNE